MDRYEQELRNFCAQEQNNAPPCFRVIGTERPNLLMIICFVSNGVLLMYRILCIRSVSSLTALADV